jgi:hypothetical protein
MAKEFHIPPAEVDAMEKHIVDGMLFMLSEHAKYEENEMKRARMR